MLWQRSFRCLMATAFASIALLGRRLGWHHVSHSKFDLITLYLPSLLTFLLSNNPNYCSAAVCRRHSHNLLLSLATSSIVGLQGHVPS
jgi:hypothetical protein